MPRDQPTDAQALYDSRSVVYDDSWHPRFARHIVELAHVQPGEHILDLACGTGLVAFATSHAVGLTGSVVGIDISSGMLAQAQEKLSTHQPNNIQFYQHDIADLHTLDILKDKKGTFDLITCASALVLLQNHREVLQPWTKYLRPGGRLIVDVTHVQNQIHGIAFEKVGKMLNRPVPSYRLNFQSKEDFERALRDAGLVEVQVTPIAQLDIEGTERLEDYILKEGGVRVVREYRADESGTVFESAFAGRSSVFLKELGEPDIKDRAKEVFKEVWRRLADEDGVVRDVDCVYVGMGWKR